MPLGLWKSKWEIHREDMGRFREDMERRDVEFRDGRIKSDERWIELKEETRELRADYDRELAETRRFNRELLIRLEKTYTNLGSTLQLMGDGIIAMRGEIHDLKSAVDAQTKAILRLVDRFEDTDGRPPV
ncbi:MAG TPA: hypothetical protein VH268_09800 [Solirubrobacterales bacterium]|jgi:hypothetical protein|nr:hypothetical protein [Solirubrobacterales bacterium]